MEDEKNCLKKYIVRPQYPIRVDTLIAKMIKLFSKKLRKEILNIT